ncbi:MAG: hypothetical protein K9H49_13970 [Bacteroidales bacterium]|nr:hypothetical protein [Bacteroidales bacterium]MCF8390278.1 hypothetical protein [Bacteroidales bacterium]
MEILEVSAKVYAEVIKTPYHNFGTSAFNDLNKNKCDQVFYLLFRKSKYRIGIIGGSREKSFYSPFSAPFGGFSFISKDIKLQYIEEAIILLKTWAREKRLLSICITLPPSIYGRSFIAKQINCFWREGFDVSNTDLSYSFNLDNFHNDYIENIWHNARKNLRISLNAGLDFQVCENEYEKKLAYYIINENRASRGYPLRMTWNQIKETIQIIQADFFLVKNNKQKAIASAIVFHISKTMIQVIYWGDLPGYSEIKPMNFLTYKVFEFYKSSGKKIVDIGPSTENSIPNYGLCEFKEGIGCQIDPKFTFCQKIN